MTDSSSWNQKVAEVVKTIPHGFVSTYGRVAAMAGFPRRARQVGFALHALPEGSGVPWHRVINAQGRISFPEDSPAYIRQRALLEAEGIEFVSGSVSLKNFGWPPL